MAHSILGKIPSEPFMAFIFVLPARKVLQVFMLVTFTMAGAKLFVSIARAGHVKILILPLLIMSPPCQSLMSQFSIDSKSSSAVLMGIMLNFSTRTLSTFGVTIVGRLGSMRMFLTHALYSDSVKITGSLTDGSSFIATGSGWIWGGVHY